MSASLKFPDENCASAWADYLLRETAGSRKQKAEALDRFIELIENSPEQDRVAFVESWCSAYIDGNAASFTAVRNGQWMRQPLFRVFAPVLEQGRRDRRPNHARWSASLYGLFCRLGGSTKHYKPGPEDLYREALSVDAGDFRARCGLIVLILDDMDYCCHELPAGLLRDVPLIQQSIADLEALLGGTVWAADAKKGLSALRRICVGEWTASVLNDARRFVQLRFRITKALLPKTDGKTFASEGAP